MATELTSIATNGFLIVTSVGGLGYMIKRWMNRTEADTKEVRNEAKENTEKALKEAKENTEKIATDLAQHNKEISQSIMGKIGDNRKFYSETYEDLKKDNAETKGLIGQVFEQMRIANGRTGKLEAGLAVQVRTCEEKTSGKKRKSDCGETES